VEHSSAGDENRQAQVGIPRFSSPARLTFFAPTESSRRGRFGTIFPESSLGSIARLEKRLVLDRE